MRNDVAIFLTYANEVFVNKEHVSSASECRKAVIGTSLIMSYKPDIPVGAIVELRHHKDDWRVVSHYDAEPPRFVRQYNIESLESGQKKRVFFFHAIFVKNTTTYEELQAFFRQQSKLPENEPMDQVRYLDRARKNSIKSTGHL